MKGAKLNSNRFDDSTGGSPGLATVLAVFLLMFLRSTALWGADLQASTNATSSGSSASSSETNLFRIGFSCRIFAGFNENDEKAAVKMWIKMIGQENNIQADPNPELFHDTAAIAEAVRNKTVDTITMTTPEYWAIRNEVKFGRMVCSMRLRGKFDEEYLLLTRKDTAIQTLGDLKGRSLLILESPGMSLARIWLDTQLMEHGFKASSNHCGTVTENMRLAKVVLPVFFRQTDACLVTREGYETMGELNPQLIQQMRVLAASAPLLASASFFRADCQPQEVEKMIEQLSRIHTTPAGRQVLAVFQTDRIIEPPPGQINSALELLARHDELCAEANQLSYKKRGSPGISPGGTP